MYADFFSIFNARTLRHWVSVRKEYSRNGLTYSTSENIRRFTKQENKYFDDKTMPRNQVRFAFDAIASIREISELFIY